jgi:hypothetical protein
MLLPKNSSAKYVPGEECSGEVFSAQPKKKLGEEFSGEECSHEECSDEDYSDEE